MTKDWRKLSYFVPILHEKVTNESGQEEFLINGTAINACTTRNGVKYTAEELKPSAKSLRNKPVLKDHNNSVDSIVGRTTDKVKFNDMEQKLDFQAKIIDKDMQEKIAQGLITNVSVGAMVKNLKREEDKDGNLVSMVAQGIDFVEISLVAVPADANADFTMAIAESFNLKELEEKVNQIHENVVEEATKIIDGGNKMAEDNKAQEAIQIALQEKLRVLEEQNKTFEARVKEFEAKEFAKTVETYKSLCNEKNVSVKEGYEKLSKEVLEAMIETIKSINVVAPVAKVEETSDKTKGEVAKMETQESKETFTVERAEIGKGFSLYTENIQEMNPVYKWR